tara:strand:+ start:178 stop:444 length:267 start_codon:yes stop_codon:yes gene_type:complete
MLTIGTTPSSLFAHSGGTNAAGCHMKHSYPQNYHCHQKKQNSWGGSSNMFNLRTTYCLNVNFDKYCGYSQNYCYALQRQYGGYCSIDF